MRPDHDAAGLQQAGDAHGKFVDSGFGVAVLVAQYLALLGEFDLSVHRARRLGQDRLVGGAAAAADGPAASVKQPALDAVCIGNGDDLFLRLVESPVGCEYAAVLAGVGVAQHDLLALAGAAQQGTVG